MPWEGSYIEVARELLAADGEICFFNGDRFDIPRLEAQGCPVTRSLDTQELFHFVYPDLPKKLGYVAPFFIEDCEPWKHLNTSSPTFYSCRDSDYLLRIHNALVSKVKAAGRWASFEREIMLCNKRTSQMSRNGIAIDEPVRVEMVATEEAAAEHVHVEVQDLVPWELKPVHPKGGYKQPSSEGRCPGEPVASMECEGDPGVVLKQHKLKAYCSNCETTQGWDPSYVKREGLRQIEVEDMAVVEGRQQVAKFLRWAKVEDFNIGSAKQLIQYIEFKLGKSAVPKAKRTGKPTVERDQLERLAKKSGDPVLLLACQASEIQARVTHLNGWSPSGDGRVHATFTNQPATFRLAAKNPNVFNFPTRSEAMHAMRRMVIPGKGYEWIVSRDYSGIEAIQVGIYAGDKDYERLAKFGIHTFMAARKAGLEVETSWPDDQLQAALKDYKKVTQAIRLNGVGSSNLYDAMKRGNHLTNYGGTANMLHASYPDVFPSRKAAQMTQDFIFDLFPKIKQWQDDVVERAHREACLVNDFGYPRWFWFVKKPVKRASGWSWERAEDAKAAIATLPQSSAAIILRRALTSPEAGELLDSGQLFLSPHDELIARATDEDDAERVSELMRLAMEAPVVEQGGRVFRTAAKKGRNWAEVE
jgi:DNA polymerase I-like protein with 3'-5' exonuclease and polymerase domains